MAEKQVFNKDNLSALLRLQADALDRGEVLEFEEGKLEYIEINGYDGAPYKLVGQCLTNIITLKPKLRVMTAEELNDIYWEFGKDFRFKCDEDIHFSAFDWCVSEMQIVGCEYSTDRGKTWNKCEVPE